MPFAPPKPNLNVEPLTAEEQSAVNLIKSALEMLDMAADNLPVIERQVEAIKQFAQTQIAAALRSESVGATGPPSSLPVNQEPDKETSQGESSYVGEFPLS